MSSKPISVPSAKPPAQVPDRPTSTLALPPSWINARDAQTNLWSNLSRARHSLLICDYDGTLAPFKADKMQAVPYPGFVERLEKLAALPKVTLALVSGRPVKELMTVFPLAASLELYGSHGREHRSATGDYVLAEATAPVRAALDAAEEALKQAGWQATLERKAASLAIHWRNLSTADRETVAQVGREVFASQTASAELNVLPFESGMELRASDHTKAHAVEALLASPPAGPQSVAAYLGDDMTDEDAFGAMGDRGISMLVREEPRPSLAHYWLRPPAQLLGFLDDWLRAAGRSA